MNEDRDTNSVGLPAKRPRVAAARAFAVLCAALILGCAGDRRVEETRLTPDQIRALITKAIPANATDRSGWASDMYAAFTALDVEPTHDNICAAVAVTEQESTFQVDPPVPNLGRIAWKEIDARAERVGVPTFVVHTALRVSSPNGKSYAERIDNVKTEKQLSEIYEDLIGIVPAGKTLFADRNPIRTGGPMQVSIAFAEAHAKSKDYPYPVRDSIRHEVFTRRGGVYFGIAHLLAYPASYDQMLYRFADFNAGHYASRNAAFQKAVSSLTGIELDLDGDLVRQDGSDAPSSTETAAASLAKRLRLSAEQIRRDLRRGDSVKFESTDTYERTFALADQVNRAPMPRAVVPRIRLQSPKITRKLTTEWFATRVDERRKRCVARIQS